MKNANRTLAAVTLGCTFLVSGCASTQGSSENLQNIEIGTTTKQQVRSQLGKPATVQFYRNLNEEAWFYSGRSGSDTLVIAFKDGDKVTAINKVPIGRGNFFK